MSALQQLLAGLGGSAGLIQSIQTFSITIAAAGTSNTATISSVTIGNAFVLFGGFTTTQNSANSAAGSARVTLTNGTTVTASRNTSSADTITVKGTVIEFKSSAIRSIQQGTIALADTVNSNTAAISSVTTGNAFVHFQGQTKDTSSSPSEDLGRLTLTNGTTVTADRPSGGNALTVGYVVVEFNSGILNSSTQEFSITMTSVTSNTATISSVTAGQAMVLWGGYTSSASAGVGYGAGWPRVTLTNGTTVTANRNSSGSTTTIVKGTVVEFKSADVNGVDRGAIALSGVNSNTAAISSVDTSKAVASYLGMSTSDGSNTFREYWNTAVLTDATTVTAAVNTATTTLTAFYEVVEFK